MLEPQIIFARVSREFPSKLLVNIIEKAHIKTLLKVRIKGRRNLVISKEGNI